MHSFDKTLASCFERTAAAYSDRIAIAAPNESVTYRDLNARADRIDAALRARGLDRPNRVALLFDQGIAGVAAILGVTKSGHIYVPLDAADPEPRLRTILHDCRPPVILTDRSHAELARALSSGRIDIIETDALPDVAAPHSLEGGVSPTEIAYILYTSGSTGVPKGVCQTHRNILQFLRTYCETFEISSEDRISWLYSMSFGASGKDVYGALLCGAALCAYNARTSGIAGLIDWIGRESVTVLHMGPSLYRHLAKHMPPERRFESVRIVNLGGEAVYPNDLALHAKHFREDCPLINLFAATEASVIASNKLEVRRDYGPGALPVGKPAPGIEIRIARQDGSAAETDEVGEIVIYSELLSPGYWQRQDLTAAAFGSDATTGRRCYRTGDMGRLDADGELRLIGRKGTRLKIRGYSVDVTEVEAALQGCSSVQTAAVVANEDGLLGRAAELVAFVIPQPGEPCNALALRRQLLESLPHYMIPGRILFVESLPYAATGKVDRRKLTALSADAQERHGDDEPPRDEEESAVAAIFQNLLSLPHVGRGADFFLAGGDSLKAVELHLRLERFAGASIDLNAVLRDATVAGIATFIRAGNPGSMAQKDLETPLVALQAQGRGAPIFLVHGRLGRAFVSPHFLRIVGPDQPVYGFRARGLTGSLPPYRTVPEMAAAYVAALRVMQPHGPYKIGGLCAGGLVALEIARRLAADNEAVKPILLLAPSLLSPIRRDLRWHLQRRLSLVLPGLWRLPGTFAARAARRVQRRIEEHSTRPNTTSIRLVKAGIRVTTAFELAIEQYAYPPYSGPVLVITSDDRPFRETGSGPEAWRNYLTGDVRSFGVGKRHNDVFDVYNEPFAKALRECLALMNQPAEP